MKLFVAILIACMMVRGYKAQSCTSANYCIGCSSTTTNACTSCFNWGSGKIGAKALNVSSSNCQTALSLTVTDAKFYIGSTTTTNSLATGTLFNNVLQCKKTYLNYTYTGGVTACSNTATSGCTAVSNCDQMVCWNNSTVTSGCRFCKRNYSATITSTNVAGATACASGNTITNCETQMAYSSGSATSALCYICKSNYAVASTALTCTSYSTDSNCRQLNSSGTCSQCWFAYYWNTSKCKLAANLMSVAMIAFAAFFFN